MKPIYLDYNATSPVAPEVASAMRPYLEEHFGNPSSGHWYGVQTKKAVEKARRQIADALGCDTDEVIFTSGGSESNNYAISGYALAHGDQGNHIITSNIEHPAVFKVCDYLTSRGFDITYVPVNEHGLVDPADVKRAITPQTILITIMHANNEVGTIEPITEIAGIAQERDIVMHTDAAQSVGKVPARVDELGVDMLSIAGHKVYAPKGIGALYVRRGLSLQKLIHGADHEHDRRAGTENVLEIVGLGQACEIAARDLEKNVEHLRAMRDRLHDGLAARIEEFKVNGHPEFRLPNTLSVSFPGIEANTLLSEVSGIAASAGAACHTDSVDISHVLEAMSVPVDYAMGTVRLSVGKMTTAEEIDQAIDLIAEGVNRLKPTATVAPSVKSKGPEVKLTHFTHGLGCACKLRPQVLERILAALPKPNDARILVGTDTADDAAVYRLDDQTALVQTLDFFTPIVDDPYDFGAIAAANALSDIYAMGGTPLFGLNIVGFPSNRLAGEVLQQILQGAHDKAGEAGIVIVGGHTVDDTEPKYGLAVTGTIDPGKILTNANAQPGDALILTKPLGLGILTTALKRGMLTPEQSMKITTIMATLNRTAAEIMGNFPVNACTDITGFGLLGHVKEMAVGARVDMEIDAAAVPIIPEAVEMAEMGVIPGGTENNMQFVEDSVTWPGSLSSTVQAILCDAQTSGGLLISLPADEAERLLGLLHKAGIDDARIVGSITSHGNGRITVG